MTSEHCIVMTTTADEDGAATLARQIVEAKLGACAQIVRIRSVYVWDGATNDDAEHLLLVKTRSALYAELEGFIREHHPYDVPEIVQVPITAGFGPYLGWIDEMTAPPPA